MQLQRIVFIRMALLMTVMTVLVSGSYALFSLFHNRQAAQALWKTRGGILGEGVQRLILWDDQVALLRLLQDEVAGSPLLRYAFVVKDGAAYVSTLPQGVPSALLRRSPEGEGTSVWEYQDQSDNYLYDISVELGQSGLFLHLGVDRRAIDREVQPLLFANFWISLGVIALGFLLAVFLARRTARDVNALVYALRHYRAMPAVETKIPAAESTEIAELIDSFQELATARKAAEGEILALNAELEGRVAERTAELAAANQELDAFAYSVSHDLRAPLRGIDGFSLALVEDFGDSLTAEGKDYLRRIRAGCVRMGTLIDDLLYLSRLARNQLHREMVDLSALAGQVRAEVAEQDPGRRVEWIIAPNLVARADPALIRAVLDNLLGNAWKFTARKKEARIEFGRMKGEGEEPFFVRDNGAGFDMLYVEKLFQVFQRLHKAEEFEGTGIGLATVQRVISRHGGRVWAQGESGRGATFYFTLKEEDHHER